MDLIAFLHHVNQMAFMSTSGPTNGRLEDFIEGVEAVARLISNLAVWGPAMGILTK